MTHLKKNTKRFSGFTLIEIIVVVVIIGIAALMAVPMFSSAADMQVRAAANRLAADVDYAKGLAVTHQKDCRVVFNPAGESYEIQKYNPDTLAFETIKNPVRPGVDYVVNFTTDSNMKRVTITSTTGLTADTVTFNYLGSPFTGGSPLNSGRIELKAENFILYVDIEPMTGYVTISGL